jgi:uncharacterized protein YodC (DUF2158 family)
MKGILDLPFMIGDSVEIPSIGTKGFIDSISVGDTNIMYRVCYWYEGQRYSTWVYEREIEDSRY